MSTKPCRSERLCREESWSARGGKILRFARDDTKTGVVLAISVLLSACGSAAPAPSSPAASTSAAAPSASAKPAASVSAAAKPAASAEASAKPAGSASAAAKPGLTKLTVGSGATVLQLSVGPWVVAQSLGFFAEEGLDVNIQGSRGGTAQIVQMAAAGQVDLAAMGPEAVVVPAGQGHDPGLKFFYEFARHPIAEVAVPPDSAIKDWKDMKGHKIGVSTLNSSTQQFGEAALQDAGVDPKNDVSFLAIGTGGQAAKALQDKTVDVMLQSDTEMATIEGVYGTKLRHIALPPKEQSLFGASLDAKPQFLQDKPQLAVAFARGVAKGTVFALTNPEATVREYWKYVPEQKPKGKSDQEALQLSMLQLQPRLDKWALDNPSDQYGKFSPDAWAATIDYLGFNGKLDPGNFYTNQFIDEVNKFDRDKYVALAKNYKG